MYKEPGQQGLPGFQTAPHQAPNPLVRSPETRCCSSSKLAVEEPLLQRGLAKRQRQVTGMPMHVQQEISEVPEISNT